MRIAIETPIAILQGNDNSFLVPTQEAFPPTLIVYLARKGLIYGKGVYVRRNSAEAVVRIIEQYKDPYSFEFKKKSGPFYFGVAFAPGKAPPEVSESAPVSFLANNDLVWEITDIKSYAVKSKDTRVLQDDYRLLIAHYAKHERGEKTTWPKEDIENLAAVIARELAERGIVLNPGNYTAAGQKLFGKILDNDPYLPHVLIQRELDFFKNNITILLSKLEEKQLLDLATSLKYSYKFSKLNQEDLWNLYQLIDKKTKAKLPELPMGLKEERHVRNKCMGSKESPQCDKAPAIEVLWAEGMAHAWFCDDCYKSWLREHPDDVSQTKIISHGIARRNFNDRESPKTLEESILGESIDPLPPLVVTHHAVCLCGSIVYGKKNYHDIDLLFREYKPSQPILTKVGSFFAQTGKRVHYIIEPKGPNWDYIPVGDFYAWPADRRLPQVEQKIFGFTIRPVVLMDNFISIYEPGSSLDSSKSEALEVFINYPPDMGLELKLKRLFADRVLSINYFEEGFEQEYSRLACAVPLYSLVFVPTNCELEKMGETEFMERYLQWANTLPAQEAIKPGVAFEPMKAVTGYGAVSFYAPDDFWEKWGEPNLPFYLEPKFDGIRLNGHVRGSDVFIFTEDKRRDRSDVLPGPVKSLKAFGKDLVIDGEMILFQDDRKTPRPRHEMAAIVSQKEPFPEYTPIHWYIFDLLYYDGEDLSDKPFEERRKKLEEVFPKDDPVLQLSPSYRITSRATFNEAFKKCRDFITSEGAMAKIASATYEVGKVVKTWAKIKLAFECKVQVIGRYLRPNPWDKKPSGDLTGAEALKEFDRLKKESRTWVLRCAYLKGDKLAPIESEKVLSAGDLELKWSASQDAWQGTDSPEVWEMGLGFGHRKAGEHAYGNTYAKAFEKGSEPEIGDIITVRPILMRRFMKNDGTSGVSWMFPNLREIDYTRKKPDDESVINEIIQAAASRRKLQEGILGKEKKTPVELSTLVKLFPWHRTFIDLNFNTGFTLDKPASQVEIFNIPDKESYWFWSWLRSASPAEISSLGQYAWDRTPARVAWLRRWAPLRRRDKAYRYLCLNTNEDSSFDSLSPQLIRVSRYLKSASLENRSPLASMGIHDSARAFFFLNMFEGELEPELLDRILARLSQIRGRFLAVLPFEDGLEERVSGKAKLATLYNVSGPYPACLVSNYVIEEESIHALASPEVVIQEAKSLPPDFEELPRDEQRKALEKIAGDWYMVKMTAKAPLKGVVQYHVRGVLDPDTLKELKQRINAAESQEDLDKIWKRYDLYLIEDYEALSKKLQEIDDKRGGKGEAELNEAIESAARSETPLAGEPPDWSKVYTRGNCHIDFRMSHPSGDYLSSSWTCSVVKIALQRLSDGKILFPLRDRVLRNQPGDQWLAFKKGIQPLEWLTIVTKREPEYWRLPGTVGATEHTAGLFLWAADVEHVPMVQKSDFHEYAVRFIAFNPELSHNDPDELNGRWDWKQIPLAAGEQWMGNRPADSQIPYILTKDKEEEEAKAKKENIELIWNENSLDIAKRMGIFPPSVFSEAPGKRADGKKAGEE